MNSSTRSSEQDLQPRLWVKLVLALLVCGVALGIATRLGNSSPNVPASASEAPNKPAVDPAGIDSVAMLTGKILKVLVKEGDRVTAGQVVAEFDPVTLDGTLKLAAARRDSAVTELKLAEAKLARLRTDLPLQTKGAEQAEASAKLLSEFEQESLKQTEIEVGSGIAEAKAVVDATKVARDYAKKELDRFAVLAPDEAATLRRSQEATRAFALAAAQLNQAEAKLAAAEANRGRVAVARKRVDEVAAGEAHAATAIEIAKAAEKDQIGEAELAVEVKKLAVTEAIQAVAIAEANLGLVKVHAPAAGVVLRVQRQAGEFAAVGTPIVTFKK